MEDRIKIIFDPKQEFSFDIMEIGVKQHIDRSYTYDIIPTEILGGTLLQNVHRLEKGTKIAFSCNEECIVYFIFHSTVDGGYSETFKNLKGWERCENYPKYDIKNPNGHGLTMVMYRTKILANVNVNIPPTEKENACCNIVFKFKTPSSLNIC